jgi:hypothetical protein
MMVTSDGQGDKLTLPAIAKKKVYDPRKVYGRMTKTILNPSNCYLLTIRKQEELSLIWVWLHPLWKESEFV